MSVLKRVMTPEHEANLRKDNELVERIRECGCSYLGGDRLMSCEEHLNDDEVRQETVTVVGGYSRRCTKCQKRVHGKVKSFHFREDKSRFEATQFELPLSWSSLTTPVFYSSTQKYPTTFLLALCSDCTLAVLNFIGWKPEGENRG